MKNIELEIAPWVLPFEEIPVSFVWDNKNKDDFLELKFDKDLDLIEILNGVIVEKTIYENLIKLILKPNFIKNEFAKGYVGIILKYSKIPIDEQLNFKILAQLKLGTRLSCSNKCNIRILRPKIFFDKISVIENKLGIELIHQGFGDIEFTIEGRVKGRVVTHSKNIVKMALENYINDSKNSKNSGVEFQKKNISNEKITFKSKQLILNVLKEIFSEEEINELNEDEINNLENLYVSLQPYLLSVIQELSNNVQLTPEARVSEEASVSYADLVKIEDFIIIIKYRDLLSNEYEPLKIPISLDILNKIESTNEIYIKIEKVKSDILRNVAEIEGE